jgi:crotonobetainyl-CoA:carnitine CoA-transferase CaiB-like acyl-CoA transferase
MASAAGHDYNHALAAVLDRNGAGAPIFFDPPILDTTGSLFTVVAILAARQGRMQRGRRCEIDLALADVGMAPQLLQRACLGAPGHASGRQEICRNRGAVYYPIYKAREGANVALGAREIFGALSARLADPSEWRAMRSRRRNGARSRRCRLFPHPRPADEAAPDPGCGPRRLRRS